MVASRALMTEHMLHALVGPWRPPRLRTVRIAGRLGPAVAVGTAVAVPGTRGGDEMNVLYIMGIASVVLFILGFLGLE